MKFVELSVYDLTEAVAFFETFHSQFSECFQTKTRDVSKQSSQYIQGQLPCLERGNMTNLTKVVPNSDNQSFQQFLSDSPQAGLSPQITIWKDELVIEKLQQQVTQLVGGALQAGLSPQITIHIDESGFVKQGAHSVGVKRQYCGRLGKVSIRLRLLYLKVENCQVGVFLGYTRQAGLSMTGGLAPQITKQMTIGNNRTLIDRQLYLPEDWALDEERRKKAGVPEEVTFQTLGLSSLRIETKAQLGLELVKEAIQRGVPFGWIGMDCHYGEQPWLLEKLSDLSRRERVHYRV